MFGSQKQASAPSNDQLPVSVHAIRSAAAFSLAQKVWSVNARTLYHDEASGKELLHFSLINPATIIWLQRDIGRPDTFELIMSWAENKATIADVFVLQPGPEPVGDDTFVKTVLDALLTTAATVPLAGEPR